MACGGRDRKSDGHSDKKKDELPRDIMNREEREGNVVKGMCGEILTTEEYFPMLKGRTKTMANCEHVLRELINDKEITDEVK